MILRYIAIFILLTLNPSISFAKKTNTDKNISSPQNKNKELTKKSAVNTNSNKIKIVVFGDSLVSGYKLKKKYSFPSVLSRALLSNPNYKNKIKVVGRGVPGETTAGGLNRIESILSLNPNIVILELGINDAFQKKNLKTTYTNLDKIMNQLHRENISILLAGMKAPPYFDKKFKKNFSNMYPYLAKKYNATLMPFFLKDVSNNSKYKLKDKVHPNSKGVRVIVNNIYPIIEEMVSKEIKEQYLSINQQN